MCICLCICACVDICLWMRVCGHLSVCVCGHLSVCTCNCVSVCVLCVYACAWTPVVCASVCVRVRVDMYVQVWTLCECVHDVGCSVCEVDL